MVEIPSYGLKSIETLEIPIDFGNRKPFQTDRTLAIYGQKHVAELQKVKRERLRKKDRLFFCSRSSQAIIDNPEYEN